MKLFQSIRSTNSRLSRYNTNTIISVASLSTKIASSIPVELGIVTPRRTVPNTIQYPEYYHTGKPHVCEDVKYYQNIEMIKIRKSAKLARKMLDYACSIAKAGMTTEEIDILAHEEIIRNGAYPSPINYYGFPKAICTSVNEVVCHGIPDNRILIDGDVLSIDVSIYLDGYHGDNCKTIIVGNSSSSRNDSAKKLIKVTEEAMMAGISVCKPGACLSKIGEAIESVAKANSYSVIHEFLGHGTGPILHMKPLVRHYKNREKFTLMPGMVFTVEPILCEGSRRIEMWADGWTAATVDGGLAAQFEHQVHITEHGYEILTLPDRRS